MPDVTVTFTDAQWTRVIAASSNIKAPNETGAVAAAYLAALWVKDVSHQGKMYEESLTTADSF